MTINLSHYTRKRDGWVWTGHNKDWEEGVAKGADNGQGKSEVTL